MLELKNVTKKFGNFTAVENLNFTVENRKNLWNNR